MPVRLFSPRPVSAGAAPSSALGTRPTPAVGSRSTRQRLRELGALGLFASATFLTLALVSFRGDPMDPSVQGGDWVGPVGSSVAGWLVMGFGGVAGLAPVELVLVGLPLFRGRSIGPAGLRVAGDLLVAIVLSSLVQVLFADATLFGGLHASGNVGLLFGELMRGLFSTLGSLLVGSTVVGMILIGRASFSFIELCGRTVELAERCWALLVRGSERLLRAWREAGLVRREQQRANQDRAVPHIASKPTDQAIIAQLADDEEPSWSILEPSASMPVAVAQDSRLGLALTTTALLDSATPSAPLAMVVQHACAAPESVSGDAELTFELMPEHTAVASVELSSRSLPPVAAKPIVIASLADEARRQASEPVAEPAPVVLEQPEATQLERSARPPRRLRQHRLPSTDLLSAASGDEPKPNHERLLEQAGQLEKTLMDHGVVGKVEEIHPGPTVTTFEVALQAGTKVSKVAGLTDDLRLGLSCTSVRIIAPIPGKNRIGFELPNDQRIPVNLRELIEDPRFVALSDKVPLPVVLGRDIVGAPFYADLASLPHVIVAGATGAGKSVGLNVMLASLLFRRSPDELRLLMIDPKVVELAPFDGIPHLLLPVVTDMKQATVALKWAVDEMERRYQLFATAGTKNIGTYNRWAERVAAGELPAPPPEALAAISADGSMVSVPVSKDGDDGRILPGKLPYIVIVIDEFADLIMQQGKEVEISVARLAQKARAAGLHVMLATQRPSVDVITGMIKANFPSRVAFLVAQRVDSRTILDEQGAEMLLGRGDMLVKLNGSNQVRRVQCPFISEDEVSALTDRLRAQGKPQYFDAILKASEEDSDGAAEEDKMDARFDEAVRIVGETQRCSTSWLQRKMTIGYNRAAKIVEAMERRGIVGPANGAKDREVLISAI